MTKKAKNRPGNADRASARIADEREALAQELDLIANNERVMLQDGGMEAAHVGGAGRIIAACEAGAAALRAQAPPGSALVRAVVALLERDDLVRRGVAESVELFGLIEACRIALEQPAKVWLLTEETNTGDSEHDTVVIGVFASPEGATQAMNAAVTDAQAQGEVVHGHEDPDNDEGDWQRAFDVEEHEVKS